MGPMDYSLLFTAWMTGLLGGTHCIGMCGGISAALVRGGVVRQGHRPARAMLGLLPHSARQGAFRERFDGVTVGVDYPHELPRLDRLVDLASGAADGAHVRVVNDLRPVACFPQPFEASRLAGPRATRAENDIGG